jgi:hypothetical protein
MVSDGAGTITESYVFGPLGIRRINHGPPLVSGGANTNYDLNRAGSRGPVTPQGAFTPSAVLWLTIG